jgi:exopolysaccharide/PEP-CTERM locus tyrosine autokinase
MSLVEQAISRLKNQNDPKLKSAPARAKAPTPINRDSNSGTTASRLNIDLQELRARGYLPEIEQDRSFAEHYRRIKRPLIEKAVAGTAMGESRVIMVASAVPGDGKTFTSINLALSMALERDMSVLLVDSDVAKQHITGIFGLSRQPGLLDALQDDRVDPESLVIPTNIRGLSLLPAGSRAEGTAELLSSNRMRSIAENLCAVNAGRILLLDSPPLLITNEGRALLKIAGQVILVVRASSTPRQAVQAAIRLIDTRQAGGLILNDVTTASSDEYYGYGKYGAYGQTPDGS